MRLRESWCRLIEDAGLQYNFVSYGQVEDNELLRGGYRVLILPRSSSLSAVEANAIQDFVSQGGVVIADGAAGTFDEHGRRLAQSQLAGMLPGPGGKFAERAFGRGKAIYVDANVLDYHRERILGKGRETRDLAAHILQNAGVTPAFAVTDEDGKPASGVETHVFRNGAITLVGLLGNPDLRVDELGPPDFRSNEHFARRRSLKLALPASLFVYDVRTGKALGEKQTLDVDLDPYEPVVYALSAAPLPSLTIAAPAKLARGETGHVAISFRGTTPAAVHILHIEVSDPAGRVVSCYSGNLRASQGHAVWSIPIAYSDAPGTWNVRVKDVLSGNTRTEGIAVF